MKAKAAEEGGAGEEGAGNVDVDASKQQGTRQSARRVSTPSSAPAAAAAARNEGKSGGGTTGSGIPRKLAGCAEISLDKCTEAKLLIALAENGLDQPPANERDKAGWAKQQLLRRCQCFSIQSLSQ
eukprot:2220221-Pleurochrysis_carterae.AAC.2